MGDPAFSVLCAVPTTHGTAAAWTESFPGGAQGSLETMSWYQHFLHSTDEGTGASEVPPLAQGHPARRAGVGRRPPVPGARAAPSPVWEGVSKAVPLTDRGPERGRQPPEVTQQRRGGRGLTQLPRPRPAPSRRAAARGPGLRGCSSFSPPKSRFRGSFRGSLFCGVEEGGHSEKRRLRKASSFMAWVLGGFWKDGRTRSRTSERTRAARGGWMPQGDQRPFGKSGRVAGATPSYTQVPTQGPSQRWLRRGSREPREVSQGWSGRAVTKPGQNHSRASPAKCSPARAGQTSFSESPQPQAQPRIGSAGPWPWPSGPEVATDPRWALGLSLPMMELHDRDTATDTHGVAARAAERQGTQAGETGGLNAPGPPVWQDVGPSPVR